MKYLFDNYPPSIYPKLYPDSIESYHRARRNFRLLNALILVAGLLIVVALYVVPHDADLGNVISFGYFMLQFSPLMLLELSSFKEFKKMRKANSSTSRKANLRPRRLLDFVSPAAFGTAVFTYFAFVLAVLYIKQFNFEWFGGYWNIVGITGMNIFFAGIVVFNMYGKKLNPHQSDEDRTRQIGGTVKALVLTSIMATVFVTISVLLSAFDLREFMPVGQSVYFQVIAVISIRATMLYFQVDDVDFEVYKEQPLAT